MRDYDRVSFRVSETCHLRKEQKDCLTMDTWMSMAHFLEFKTVTVNHIWKTSQKHGYVNANSSIVRQRKALLLLSSCGGFRCFLFISRPSFHTMFTHSVMGQTTDLNLCVHTGTHSEDKMHKYFYNKQSHLVFGDTLAVIVNHYFSTRTKESEL